MGGDRHDSECKIYVGGLAPETSTESLERHFMRHGEVADCIVMSDKADGRSRGFGFVTFKDSSAANAALGTANSVDGRDVSTKKAVREGQASSNASLASDGSAYNVVKVFVGGLPSSCDHDKLTGYFGKFGRIVDAVVMMDQQTQRHRGFGYVTFDEPSAVESAMAVYSDNRIDGKWVEVKRCIPQDQMRDGGGSKGKADRDRDGRDRDGRDSRSSPIGYPATPPPGYPAYDPYAYYRGAGADPHAAYAAYYASMGYQHPAYAAYGYPPAGYGAYGVPMSGYPPNGGAYAAYGAPSTGYPQDPRQQYLGAPPMQPSLAPPPAAPLETRSRSRSGSHSRSRSKSRSPSRSRRRRRSRSRSRR